MSSLAASFTAAPAIPGAQAALTERNAGWGRDVNAVSARPVFDALQSSNVHSASGEPLQSPVGQNRPPDGPGGGGGIGRIAPGAIWAGSPSDISASQLWPSSPGALSPVQPGAHSPAHESATTSTPDFDPLAHDAPSSRFEIDLRFVRPRPKQQARQSQTARHAGIAPSELTESGQLVGAVSQFVRSIR